MSNLGYGSRDLSRRLEGKRFGRRRSRGWFSDLVGGGRGRMRARGGRRATTIVRDVGRDVGDSARHLARRVGPQRGLIGLLVLGGTILGSIFLVRRMRERREERTLEGQGPEEHGRKLSARKRRRAMNEYIATTHH